MASGTTRVLLEVRINAMLSASAPASHWVAGALDEALATTLEEYSRAKPYTAVSLIAPPGREFTVTGLPTVVGLTKVWYPYTVAAPEYPPRWIDFDFWLDQGTPRVLLHGTTVPDGVLVARIWYNSIHTLGGLAGQMVTTFPASDDSIMVIGACGYACLQRSTELDETLQNMAVSTPNYGALSQIFLDRFHAMLYAPAVLAAPLGPDGMVL